MDGVLIDLLKTKWNTFVKRRFYRQFFLFAFYFLISLVCFTLRPGPPEKSSSPPDPSQNTTENTTDILKIPFDINNKTFLNITNITIPDIRSQDEDIQNTMNQIKIEIVRLTKDNITELNSNTKNGNCSEINEDKSSIQNKTVQCQKIRSNSGGPKDYMPKGMQGRRFEEAHRKIKCIKQ